MKIVLDTATKQAVCPPEFFENVRKINDASELTGSTKKSNFTRLFTKNNQ